MAKTGTETAKQNMASVLAKIEKIEKAFSEKRLARVIKLEAEKNDKVKAIFDGFKQTEDYTIIATIAPDLIPTRF